MLDLTLVFGNCNYSSWSLRAWFYLRQQGIAFTEQQVSLFTPEGDAVLANYFSDEKVPILLDGNREVWDSLAILEYLSERPDLPYGWPLEAGARATARAISAEMHASFPAIRNELPMNCRRYFPGFLVSPAAQREIDRVTTLWQHCREHYGQSGPWLFGDFSIADSMYAPVVLRFLGYGIALDPVSQAYADYLYQTPVIQEWLARGRVEEAVIQMDEADAKSVPWS